MGHQENQYHNWLKLILGLCFCFIYVRYMSFRFYKPIGKRISKFKFKKDQENMNTSALLHVYLFDFTNLIKSIIKKYLYFIRRCQFQIGIKTVVSKPCKIIKRAYISQYQFYNFITPCL